VLAGHGQQIAGVRCGGVVGHGDQARGFYAEVLRGLRRAVSPNTLGNRQRFGPPADIHSQQCGHEEKTQDAHIAQAPHRTEPPIQICTPKSTNELTDELTAKQRY
jgi:hypothetical protein